MEKQRSEEKKIPEILAPAGTPDAMRAAVNAGCDAVYMGGSMFSARAYAQNFGKDEMISAIDHCHLFGVKVYMTVNTLLKEEEAAGLEEYMIPYYEAGLDAVIVQDMGAVRILRHAFPDLKLHASTQMSISSEYGARLMKNLGFTRIVPSRELSLEEIISIKQNADIEIETFIHGAMCYAYSGKCLFSSFFGGRSGNRGRCAQPCRQKYYIDNNSSFDPQAPYIMSLKDMCTLSVLPELTDAGIDSFKIEGRMKNPYYVAAVTDAYRCARDKYIALCRSETIKYRDQAQTGKKITWTNLSKASQDQYMQLAHKLTQNMQDIYNRGGFHTGYYFTEKGPEMTADRRPNHEGLLVGKVSEVKAPQIRIRLINSVNAQDVLEIQDAGTELTADISGKEGSVICLKGRELRKIRPGMKVFRTRNNTLLNQTDENIIKNERKKEAFAHIRARVAEPLQIIMQEPENRKDLQGSLSAVKVMAQGDMVKKAEKAPVTAERLISQMQKTGGTNLQISAECEIDEDAFVAMSDFNNVRREAMEKYRQALCERYHRNRCQ